MPIVSNDKNLILFGVIVLYPLSLILILIAVNLSAHTT